MVIKYYWIEERLEGKFEGEVLQITPEDSHWTYEQAVEFLGLLRKGHPERRFALMVQTTEELDIP